MTNAEPAVRMPKEATCDVECAMKVESLRILSKKRRQQQSHGAESLPEATPSSARSGRGVKRAFPGSPGLGPQLAESSSERPLSACALERGMPALERSSSLAGKASTKDSSSSKEAARRRFVWSVPLHQDFVAAVFDIGLKCASPKLLLEMMPVVDGLTSEHIKSHLQKYRLHRKRSREEFLKSYGYLTDLDGGKGMGGGSAAATIKAAAAAAGDARDCSPRSPRDSTLQGQVNCGVACDCHDVLAHTSREGADRGCGYKVDDVTPTSATGASSVVLGREGVTSAIGDSGGVQLSDDSAGGTIPSGLGVSCAAGSIDSPLQRSSAGCPRVETSVLLQSHLALLARGIDMQIKFHNHLREVVVSQRRLQGQLNREQAGQIQSRPMATSSSDRSGGRASPTPAEHPPTDQSADRRPQSKRSALPTSLSWESGSLSQVFPDIPPETVQGVPASASPWTHAAAGSPACVDGAAPPVGFASDGTGYADAVLNPDGHNFQPVFGLSRVSDDTSSDTGGAGSQTNPNAGGAIGNSADLRYSGRTPDGLPQHNDTSASPLVLPSAGRSSSSMPQRGYLPGDYTLISRGAEGVLDTHGPLGVIGVGSNANAGLVAARNPSGARTAMTALGRMAPVAATSPSEHDMLELKRHMQAQMEMQRTMLDTRIGGITPANSLHILSEKRGASTLAAGGGVDGGVIGGSEAARTSAHNGGGGAAGGHETGGGAGEGASGAMGSKEQYPDALPSHELDIGDPFMVMGLL